MSMIRTSLLSIAALAGVAGFNGTAKADVDWQFRFNVGGGLCQPERRIWVEPVYETRCERVWVEPVYETRCDRQWIEPVYETRCERVWVDPVYENREVRYRDRYGRIVTRCERVLVREGYWSEQPRQVLVCEGRWVETPRQVCVREGYWSTVEKRVCVREGYWTSVPVRPEPSVQVRIGDRHDYDRDRNWGRDDRRGGYYDRGDRYRR
ncbi:MAG: hypothetical protein QM770_09540 [Tepidisphaeraceae bacterium]